PANAATEAPLGPARLPIPFLPSQFLPKFRSGSPRRKMSAKTLLQPADLGYSEGVPDLDNAIYVSYLEKVFLEGDDELYRYVISTLSDRLRAALVELEEGWKEFDARQRERS